jgi:hypothetical protein
VELYLAAVVADMSHPQEEAQEAPEDLAAEQVAQEAAQEQVAQEQAQDPEVAEVSASLQNANLHSILMEHERMQAGENSAVNFLWAHIAVPLVILMDSRVKPTLSVQLISQARQ